MVRGALHHVSLEVSDIARARFFYDRFLLPLGYRRFATDPTYLGYTDGALTLWLLKSHRPRVHRKAPDGDEEVIAEHLAFRLPSPSAVTAREAELTRAEIYPFFRGEEHPEFSAGYFSASWVDPDGIVLELYAMGGTRASRRSRTPGTRARAARPTRKRARAPRRGRASR